MIVLWMMYCLLVGVLLAGASRALEEVCRAARVPVRFVWLGALVGTVGLAGLAPFRAPVMEPPVAFPRAEVNSATGAASLLEVEELDRGGLDGIGSIAGVTQARQLELNASLSADYRAGLIWRIGQIRAFLDAGGAALDRALVIGWVVLTSAILLSLLYTLGRSRRVRRSWPLRVIQGTAVRVAPDHGPAVAGVLGPEVIMPAWLLEHPEEEQRLAVAHESEHVRARDPVLLLLGCVITALLPWHPAAWWMLSRLRLAVELDCDARVLRGGVRRRAYGSLLLDIAERYPSGRVAGATALIGVRSHLERRLLAMTESRIRLVTVRTTAIAGSAAVMLLVACEAQLPKFATLGEMRGVLEEELRIDGITADLVPVRAVAVASDGTIAVTQEQDAHIRFFDANGEPLEAVGGRGQGPGEFLSMVRIGWLADTLWVLDQSQSRISLISPSRAVVRTVGDLPRTVQAKAGNAAPQFSSLSVNGIREDGSLSAFLYGRSRTTIGRLQSDGMLERVIALLPEEEGGIVFGPRGMNASLPFGNIPVFATSPDGSRFAFAMASLDGEHAGTFHVIALSADGDTLFSRRYAFDAEPLPAALADSVFNARIARLQPDVAAAARQQAKLPSVYPPLAALLIGRDGTIWIQGRDRDEARPYYVLTASGDPLGMLVLPTNSRIAVAERDRVWLIERDEVDVESVVRHGVTWHVDRAPRRVSEQQDATLPTTR